MWCIILMLRWKGFRAFEAFYGESVSCWFIEKLSPTGKEGGGGGGQVEIQYIEVTARGLYCANARINTKHLCCLSPKH